MDAEQQLLQSRIETIQSLLNIIKVKLLNLDPLEAITYTQPLSDELLRTAHGLVMKEKREQTMKEIDNLLEPILKIKN